MAGGSIGNEGMEKMIHVVNRLQDAFASSGMPFGLELPQIVVVGGQSAGKSSVLENFVGKDFLPRGAGIVTRRPLVLQLHTATEEYAEFLHMPGRKYKDFNEVRQEIEAATDKETGSNKGISSNPINLRVYSPNVLNLTLVDLPGMTRVPVGDQPPDIEVQIRNMVMEFIQKESSLILAVSPANSDLANSDAMKVAREVDPSGSRTIGVITKLDLMDQGTDAREILLNNLLPLKRGYVGVVNRSQRDIEGRKDIKAAMQGERMFFLNQPAYKDMVDRMGTPFLQQVLNKELGRHIQQTLPQIRQNLRAKMLEVKKELGKLEDTTSPAAMRSSLMKMVQDFAAEVETQIQGLNADIDTDRLAGGAKINRLFYNEFASALAIEEIPADILRKEIAFAIRNIHGVRNGIFTPDMAFNATVVKIIREFREPVQDCVGLVADVLEDVVGRAAQVIKHDKLREEVQFLVKNFIQERSETAKKTLMTHVDAETAFMNTRHEDFIGKSGDVSHELQDTPEFTQSLDNVKRKLESGAKVVHRGWLYLHIKKTIIGGSQEYWFTITTEAFTWYKDKHETDDVFSLHLTPKIKYRTDEKAKDKKKIFLYKIDGKPMMLPDVKTLDVSCSDDGEFDKWIAALKTCGIYPEDTPIEGSSKSPGDKDEAGDRSSVVSVTRRKNHEELRRNRQTVREFTKSMANPGMDRQIETIRTMVVSYLKIVGKTIRDLAPKYIILLVVNDTQKYVVSELTPTIMAENDVVTLMTENVEDKSRRDDLQKILKTAEDALRIISDAGSLVIT